MTPSRSARTPSPGSTTKPLRKNCPTAGRSRALLAPACSGLLITRSDLAHAAAATGLGARPGGRAFTLQALIEQDRAATFGWLAQRAAWWAEQHRAGIPALGSVASHWLSRAQSSQHTLEQIPQHT